MKESRLTTRGQPSRHAVQHSRSPYRKPYRDGADRLAADVLEVFAGNGTVRIIERLADAVLLERLDPGTPLSTLVANGQDDEATRILVRTIQQMRADSIPAGVPAAADLGVSFASYLESGDRRLPPSVVRDANRIYGELCASQTDVRLLHGDLHHDNVLFDARRGWVAIDPKGVIGEVEYEVAAALRNPIAQPAVFAEARVFARRLDVLADELRLDAERVKRWAFATAVLAAIWIVEDDDDLAVGEQWIALADTLAPRDRRRSS